jgi:hypothetical protein
MESASWKSPIGDAPALTAEQEAQNTANTHILAVMSGMKQIQSWDLTDDLA